MTPRGLISPTHKAIRKYYEDLHALRDQRVLHEMGLRPPFQRLLEETARLKKWTLIAELSEKTSGGRVQPDGTLRDGLRQAGKLILKPQSARLNRLLKKCFSRSF